MNEIHRISLRANYCAGPPRLRTRGNLNSLMNETMQIATDSLRVYTMFDSVWNNFCQNTPGQTDSYGLLKHR